MVSSGLLALYIMYFNLTVVFPSRGLLGGRRGGDGTAAGYNVPVMGTKEEERVYTVGEVNRLADGLLQGLVLWVEGEVSNLRPYPNYSFFSLSDEDASLSCIIFREALAGMDCELREGMSLLARGRLGVYVRRGQFRLNVLEARESGEGRLRREFLLLMRKLAAEGLFDEALKRPLPAYPHTVGLITSLEGAAVRDVVINLKRRFPGTRLLIRGVRVQGDEAVGDIVGAIDLFNRAQAAEVLILARGGGSLEDLKPFNSEEVARAIRASHIPVVTGVGHEPDITLSDLAADFRASTPTGAAEAVVPSREEVLALLRQRELALASGLRRGLHRLERGLGSRLTRRPFSDPAMLVNQAAQRLAEAEEGLISSARSCLERRERAVEAAALSLARFPREYRALPSRIEDACRKLSAALRAWVRWRETEPSRRAGELKAAAVDMISRTEGRLRLVGSRLDDLSPLAVLSRGYAIVTREGETRPLTDSAAVEIGDGLDIRLHHGRIRGEVREVRPEVAEERSPEG